MGKPLSNYTSNQSLQALGEEFSIALTRWAARSDPQDLWQSCASCRHMAKKGPAFCSLYKMVPPVHVIVGTVVCEGWVDEEEIPF